MTLRCLGYRVLDRFRFSRLATKWIYRGVPVQILQPSCTVTGTVTRIDGGEIDGDTCFDLQLSESAEMRHCEVTPCAPDAVKQDVRTLRPQMRVRVTGSERFDPAHLNVRNTHGWLEMHPVTAIEVLP